MQPRLSHAALLAACLFLFTPPGCATTPLQEDAAPQPAASAFLAENAAAMERMMVAMDVSPTGDVDRDFVAMMVPHHQGAIDMARAVLRYGKNEQIRRLAQEIIVTQQQEIAAMQLAIDAPLPAPAPAQLPAPTPAPAPPANAGPHHRQHSAKR
ncbi:DUF305 domain-containing protein [Lysobacter terrestris]|uniref:DUF305 domain-containing protein n=2 Tax=Agrilutibacter terrestris TaxID=2865112 RepID=A0A7H0G1I4_9GAMM|nr:DUF305 domain-containing protein [Lysobacter terrestris]